MYEGIAILKSYGEPTFDEYGNEIENIQDTTVYVEPRGVYASEYYNAAQIGLKPSLSLYMASLADYAGQQMLEYEGRIYNVIRVDRSRNRDGITLICEERAKHGA